MAKFLDLRTLLTMSTAFAVALYFAWPRDSGDMLTYLGYRLLLVGDMLFHEMGHAVFHWVFGHPAVPGIMTIFGSEIAPGYTLYFNHSWIFQIFIWGGFAYGLWWLREERPGYFLPAAILAGILVVLSFTRYPELIGVYMGHGSAIFCGAVLLTRAWADQLRTATERWLNALFGFFIVLNNGFFAYQLIHSASFSEAYQRKELAEDFTQMTDIMFHWTIPGIALFTLVYAAFTLILSVIAAALLFRSKYNISA